ncbi:MAG: 30S ribosomal protein S4e [Candidatus Methanoplasma sp.]|jgi:small subunit ribosomal protein S4e|nr:30S ribosomal protein S4e [Candidatus Methanoplasma sp.]
MSDHMKRLNAPRTWPIKRKLAVWVTKQSPGAHSLESSLPAVVVLRDLIGACDTAKEAKRIIGNRELIVDGKPVKNPKAPIGVMDTISIPKTGQNFRLLLTDKGKLAAVGIEADEAGWKLARVEGKTIVKGGKIQLNLSGGRNILLDKNDHKSGDTLKIGVIDQNVLDSYALKEGAYALIIHGSLAGKILRVTEKVQRSGSADNTVKFEGGAETVQRNVFIVGSAKPEIKIPEAPE